MSFSLLSISYIGLFPVLFILNKFWSSFNAQFKFSFFEVLFTPYSELLNYLCVPLVFDSISLPFPVFISCLFFCNCFLPLRHDICYYLVCPLFALILQIIKQDFNGWKNKIIRNVVIKYFANGSSLLNFHIIKQWSLEKKALSSYISTLIWRRKKFILGSELWDKNFDYGNSYTFLWPLTSEKILITHSYWYHEIVSSHLSFLFLVAISK